MKSTRTSVPVALLSATLIFTSASGFAQNHDEVDAMSAAGFHEIAQGVWQRSGAEGGTQRVGFGSAGLRFLVDSMDEKADVIAKSASAEHSMSQLLMMQNAISILREAALEAESNITDDALKASGNNGCSPTLSVVPAASVTPSTSTAQASVGTSLWSPPMPWVARIAAALIYKSGSVSMDLDGAYGTSGSPFISVSTTAAAGTSTCLMFAYGQYAHAPSGCAVWTDAMFQGTCN